MDKPNFIPLLFAGDINVYSVARAFHEAYGVVSVVYGKFPGGPCANSSIIDYRTCPQNEDGPTFLSNVTRFGEEHPDKTVLVLGCGDSYVKLCARYKDAFPKNCLAPYIDLALMETLTNKEEFYALCDRYGIDRPATFIHRAELGHDFTLPFGPPYICKPANSVAYWEHPFPGNDKVFLLQTRAELEATLDRVYASGYPDSMIIQEYVPGDDSRMRVLTCYSNSRGQVKLMCLGHVLLEDHTPHGLGNHTVILTEDNPAVCEKFRTLLEGIGYVGFSNFDIKYDSRDGKYKAFEINCRQGRSNYYVTGCGQNIARWLVEDVLEGKEQEFTHRCAPALWSVVPLRVAYRYTPRSYHPTMRQLVKAGQVTHSLRYKGDRGGLKRTLRFWKGQLRYFKNYRDYYAPPAGED